MKNTDCFNCKGYWWLPNKPEDKVAGILTFTPEKSIILELIGCFDSIDLLDVVNRVTVVPIIHGIDSSAKEITLIDCHVSFSQNFSSTFPITKLLAHYLVYDRHIQGLEERCNYKAYVRFPELSFWAFPGKIQHIFPRCENGSLSDSLILRVTNSEKECMFNVNCGNGISLSVYSGVSYNTDDMLRPHIEQYSYLEITGKVGLSLKDIYSQIFKFERFLSLATKRRVSHSEIWLNDPETCQRFDNGKVFNFPIYILDSSPIEHYDRAIDPRSFLFTYNDIAQDIGKILPQWMSDSEDLAPIRRHLVDSLMPQKVFSSVDFLIVVQSLEGFWYRFKENEFRALHGIGKSVKVSLKNKISDLLECYSCIPEIARLELNLDEAVQSRDYFSHFMRKCEKKHAVDGIELYYLTKPLKTLLTCCVLDITGFSAEMISMILSRQKQS